MKRLAIFVGVCLVLLLASAALTRPTPDSFPAYLHDVVDAHRPGLVKPVVRGLANDISPDNYLRTVAYHNYGLWETVTQDGRPQYAGAFSHWFKRT